MIIVGFIIIIIIIITCDNYYNHSLQECKPGYFGCNWSYWWYVVPHHLHPWWLVETTPVPLVWYIIYYWRILGVTFAWNNGTEITWDNRWRRAVWKVSYNHTQCIGLLWFGWHGNDAMAPDWLNTNQSVFSLLLNISKPNSPITEPIRNIKMHVHFYRSHFKLTTRTLAGIDEVDLSRVI